MRENIIIYDWLSFTSKIHDTRMLIEALGLNDVPWQTVKGANGYRDRFYYNCISIHFNGRDDMGVWVELSGQGCRAFEQQSTLQNPWEDIFEFIRDNDLNMTRLDVAYDDHDGLLDIDQISKDTQTGEFVSRANFWKVVLSSKGSTVQVGSDKSEVLIRIYDKARERNCSPGTHWIRCELQLRNERAMRFSQLPYEIGEAFCGVVVNYLRFVEPDIDDKNRWRWPMKPYWGDFLCDASAVRIYEKPGLEYNLERCENFVINQAGNAVDAYIKIVGVSGLLDALKERRTKRNPKYDALVKQWESFSI